MSELIVLRGPIGAGKSSIMQALRSLLPHSSCVEIDALKRMIDPDKSSMWRREVSLAGSLALSELLLRNGRSVITETHARWPDQTARFSNLATRLPDVHLSRFLVTAPYEVCLQRTMQRRVPGIKYAIDATMVDTYYTNLEPLPDEAMIDTSVLTSEESAVMILNHITTSKGAENVCVES